MTFDPTDSAVPRLRMTTSPLALPAGMRDMLPPRASHRRALGRAVLNAFSRYGYELIALPAFEREEVIARGLSASATRDLVRLLDPDSGEVMVLRPDMTPQIARVISTRYRAPDGPVRLSYEGSVVRRPKGRARRHRQIAQAGIECVGWPSTEADIEVISAVHQALCDAGVKGFRIELSHARIAHAALEKVPDALRDEVAEAMAVRDARGWQRALASAPDVARTFDALDKLAGGVETLAHARKALVSSHEARALDELSAVIDGLAALGIGDVLVDLGELRGLGYYTGVQFLVLCEGVGEPLAAGGRYDELLGRYGAPRAATGCAIDLEALEEALELQGRAPEREPERVLVAGARADRIEVAQALRAAGAVAVESDHSDEASAHEYAQRRGGFTRVVWCPSRAIEAAGAR